MPEGVRRIRQRSRILPYVGILALWLLGQGLDAPAGRSPFENPGTLRPSMDLGMDSPVPLVANAGTLGLYADLPATGNGGAGEQMAIAFVHGPQNVFTRSRHMPEGWIEVYYEAGKAVLSTDVNADGGISKRIYYPRSLRRGGYIDTDGDGLLELFVDDSGRAHTVELRPRDVRKE